MHALGIVLFAIVALNRFGMTDSLKCYVNVDWAIDTFNTDTPAPSNNNKGTSKDCGDARSCIKLSYDKNAYRLCGDSNDAVCTTYNSLKGDKPCYEVKSGGDTADACCCTTDNCNLATGTKAFGVFVFFGIFVAFVNKLY